MAEHRVSMLGGPLRRYEDPAQSRDPRIRDIVAALATLEPAPAPRAHFRAELRAQLVAVAPRLVAEPESETPPVGRHAAHAPGVRRNILSGIRLSRPLAAVAATVVVLAMILGGAVLISKKSQPGDHLYGLKRASESAQLALAPNASARAKLRLNFASTHLDEVASLLPGGANASGVAQVSPHVVSLVDSTLASADSDVMSASQTLGAQAIQNNSPSPLDALTTWAPGELNQLQKIVGRLPAGAARDHAQATYTLVSQVLTRASMLQAEAGCACLHSAPSDQLGPIPCPQCVASANPGTPGLPGTVTSPPAGTSTSASDSGNGGGTNQTGTQPSSGASPTGPGLVIPTILPTGLPPLPSASLGPIGIGTCGISISLSPINLHLGTCKPTHS
jgi:hypothetical protein